MKKQLSTILLILILFVGLCLLLYPTVSNYWNTFNQSRAIVNYAEQVAHMDEEECRRIWYAAQDYNQSINEREDVFSLTQEQAAMYKKQLSLGDSDIIAYVEIPNIQVSLPIYHGTEEGILQVAVGHLEWTSLPVGGESTHCVLSGHRGLPSARLFTDLDQLNIGDVFILRTLDKVLTYEIDQILTVRPEETDALMIQEKEDLCTLVTCTPYGVNSHRMLVRGHRVENQEQTSSTLDSVEEIQKENRMFIYILIVFVLFILLIALSVWKRRRK